MNPQQKLWLLIEGKSETGPFTYAQLQRRYASREIHGDILCYPKTFWSAKGWLPLRHYFPEFDRTARSDSNQSDSGRSAAPTAIFQCLLCKADLRIPLLPGSCRCPHCKARYTVRQVQNTPATFLIIPQVTATSVPPSSPPPRRRQVPPAVKSALAALGLNDTAELQEARQAYRKVIQSYHPDKVAHLGPELRHVAETKTKELNTAFTTIEAFFNSQ